MLIKPIKTGADHQATLKRIDALMDAEYDTAEGDELDALVTLAEAYEKKHVPIEAPDPVEFIKHMLEFRGEDQSALARLLHSRPRASEILNRKRKLTLSQVRRISEAWGVPADPLVQDYELS